jgi:stalled ribosome rescue protein Dom34
MGTRAYSSISRSSSVPADLSKLDEIDQFQATVVRAVEKITPPTKIILLSPDMASSPYVTYSEMSVQDYQLDLLESCSTGNEKNVKKLLEKNLDLEIRDAKGNSALHIACGWGYVNIVSSNLDKSAGTLELLLILE